MPITMRPCILPHSVRGFAEQDRGSNLRFPSSFQLLPFLQPSKSSQPTRLTMPFLFSPSPAVHPHLLSSIE